MNGLIETINRAGDGWWSYVAPAAWQAALVGLLLLAVAAIGRRWPSPVRFAILALALIKFAIPPLAAVPSGIFSQFCAEQAQRPVAAATEDVATTVAVPVAADRIAKGADVGADRVVVLPVEPVASRTASPARGPEAAAAVSSSPVVEPVRPAVGVKAWLMLGHLAGVAAMLGLIAIQYRCVLRITRTAECVGTGPLYEQYAALCRTLGLRHRPQLLLAASGQQPFSFGTLRASVVLPERLVHRLSLEQLRAALAHELAHHRRCDLWLNWFQVLLCAAWWFHPVVWLLNRAMRAAREDCCDDLLLAESLVGDHAYCGTLLEVATSPIGDGRSSLTLTMSDSPHPLGRRFRRIMDSTLRRWPKLPVSALAALAIVAAVLLPGMRRAGVADESTANAAVAANEGADEGKAAAESLKDDAGQKPAGKGDAKRWVKMVSVSGMVVDEAGKAVVGAVVEPLVWGRDRATVKSDAKGGFTLPVSYYQARGLGLVARNADGTQQAYFEYEWQSPSGEQMSPAKLVMKAARAIDVRVKDADGKPVSGARIGVIASYYGLDSGRSDSEGRCVLRAPADAPLESVYALKSGKGLDYVSFPGPERATTWAPDLSRPLTLKFEGAMTYRVKCVDSHGKPISGVSVVPTGFDKPGWSHIDGLNVSGTCECWGTTDSSGVAVFDWIPVWGKQWISFGVFGDGWSYGRLEWKPSDTAVEKTVQLVQMVALRGRVRGADGRPASDVMMEANGHSESSRTAGTWTDERGRYEIRIVPGEAYSVAVVDNRYYAPARSDVIAKEGKPVEGVDFDLVAKTTRIEGRVTVGREKKAWRGQSVRLDEVLPDEDGMRRGVTRWATTDAEGKYSFVAGPGNYTLWCDDVLGEKKVVVRDEKEQAFDFHVPRDPRGTIMVRVVDRRDPGTAIPNAKVIGSSISSMCHGDLEATTNGEGWFRVKRWQDKMAVVAWSKDKKLTGSVTVGPDDTEATIPIGPAGALKGQVIDVVTGEPMRNRTVRFEVFYHYELPAKPNAGIGSSRLAQSVKTDAEGRFEMDGLVPGEEYTLSAARSENETERKPYDRICKATPRSGETVDLGVVGARSEMSPGEAMTVALTNRRPVDGRLAQWAREANAKKKRTLVAFWTNAGRDQLTEILGSKGERLNEYLVISSQVEPSQFEVTRLAFAKKWGFKESNESWPVLCILDVDGKTLVVKDSQDFAKNGEIDQGLVEEFWRKNVLPANAVVPAESATPPAKKKQAPAEKKGQTGTTPAGNLPMVSAVGRVLDSEGMPVAGATVYLREWSTYLVSSEPWARDVDDILATTRTDADGAFRFEPVSAKKIHDQWMRQNPWDVVVAAKGHAIAWRHLRGASSDRPYEIRLSAAERISGRVSDAQGKPLGGAEAIVSMITSLDADTYSSLDDPETFDLQDSRLRPRAKTDADGRVTIEGLPRNARLLVRLTHPDHHSKLVYVATSKEPQPDLDVPKFENEKRVSNLQKVFPTEFSAALEPPAPRILGRVIAADTKKPLVGVIVDELQSLGTKTDAEGRFTFEEVRHVPYRLLVIIRGESKYLGRLVNVALLKDKRDTPILIELPLGEIVSGSVVDAKTGGGVPGVNVLFDNGFDINRAKTDGLLGTFGVTDASGRFHIGVPAGKGKLKIFGPVAGYDLPGRVYTGPGQEPDDDPEFVRTLDIVAGKPVGEVKFTVSRGESPAVAAENYPQVRRRLVMVQGVVVDPKGAPVAGAEVGSWASLRSGDKMFRTDGNGRFAFRVPEYQLSESIVVKDEGRKLFGYVGLGKEPLKAAKGPLTIRLKPTGTVTGRVVEGDKPLAGISVQLDPSGPQGERYCLTTKTDDGGVFRFTLVEADREFYIHVFGDKYADGEPRMNTGRVAAGGTYEVKPFVMVRLDKSVSGIVVDPDGKAVAGALVSASLRSGGSIPRAFLQYPTRSDGRFVIRGVPDRPLTVMAYMQAGANPRGGRIRFPAHVDAEPGQTDVRIVLDPKLVKRKQPTNETSR